MLSRVFNTARRTARSSFRDRSPNQTLHFPEEPLDLPVAQEGGFYAATLNSTLNSRYTLIGKLGYGSYSSVWLARDDSKLPDAYEAYVAVKIMSTYVTEAQEVELSELEILQHIKAHAEAHPGGKHVTRVLDSFTVIDHHGPHLCLVFEVLGTFRSSVYRPGNEMSVPIVKHVTKQLLLALDFLHRECGIIHADIKPDNILITIPESKKQEYIQRYTSAQSKARTAPPLRSGSSLPIVLSRHIIPFPYDEAENTYILEPDFEIQLADYGTAARVDGPHDILIQPDALRSPEVILGMDWDTSADIWNLGCLIFDFLTGNWLFNPKGGPTWTPDAYHLGCMPSITGEEFDLEYVRQSDLFHSFFSPEGKLLLDVQRTKTLEQILDVYDVLDDVEKPLCVDFLGSMLRLNPSNRATANELLDHPWIQC